MKRKLLLVVAASVLALSAAACNTVKGAGEDIQSVAEAGNEVI